MSPGWRGTAASAGVFSSVANPGTPAGATRPFRAGAPSSLDKSANRDGRTAGAGPQAFIRVFPGSNTGLAATVTG